MSVKYGYLVLDFLQSMTAYHCTICRYSVVKQILHLAIQITWHDLGLMSQYNEHTAVSYIALQCKFLRSLAT